MKRIVWATLYWLLLTTGQAFALEVVSLAPTRGGPGTLVAVSGGPFSSATQPFLGDHYVVPLQVLENRLEFAVPYLPPGTYLLTIQDNAAVAEQSFQFEVTAPAPQITGLNPRNLDVCSSESEQRLDVSGHNFMEGAVLLIDNIAVPTRSSGPTRLEATLQGFQQPGVFGVLVRNPDGATSLPQSLWVDSIPEIASIEQGSEFLDYYEVIIHGKNFLPNSILVVKEPEDRLISQAYRQFSFTVRNRGLSEGMSVAAPQRGRVEFVDCQTLIYSRYPTITQSRSLGFMIFNPDGHKTDIYYADLP